MTRTASLDLSVSTFTRWLTLLDAELEYKEGKERQLLTIEELDAEFGKLLEED